MKAFDAALFLIAAVALLSTSQCAHADEFICPKGVPSCRILILTPQEELALTQPNGILDTAQQARFLDLANTVKYFMDKIAKSPQGKGEMPAQGGTPEEKK